MDLKNIGLYVRACRVSAFLEYRFPVPILQVARLGSAS
jgi:hypothetical protein